MSDNSYEGSPVKQEESFQREDPWSLSASHESMCCTWFMSQSSPGLFCRFENEGRFCEGKTSKLPWVLSECKLGSQSVERKHCRDSGTSYWYHHSFLTMEQDWHPQVALTTASYHEISCVLPNLKQKGCNRPNGRKFPCYIFTVTTRCLCCPG